MADFSVTLKTAIAFQHSKSRAKVETNQQVYESKYKSAHSTLAQSDVWADTIAYAATIIAADAEAAANPAVTKHAQVDLTPMPGTNNQTFYFDNAGVFVRPWISPSDISEPTTAEPSYGYQMQLYQQDLTLIPPTFLRWTADYYSGIVTFEAGFTPVDAGYALPLKATIYAYTGTFAGGGTSGGASFTVSQVAHGFTTLTPIYHDGVSWVAAQADAADSLGTHIVTAVSGADAFTASNLGKYTITAHGLTVGEYYYVDDAVAGNLVDTQPNTFSNPIIYVESADVIHVLHLRPTQSGALGISLSGDGIEENKVAQEDLTANKVVGIDSITEEVFLADRTVPTHEDRIFGITRVAALATERVDVRVFGELEDLTWTWTPTLPIYVDTVGNMTQVAPAVGFKKSVGYALTATKMFVTIQNPAQQESIGSYPDFRLDGGAFIQTDQFYELDGGSFV